MKKLIAIITLFFFLLGPGGLRQAHALAPLAVLNPATLGLMAAAAGVISAGVAYYAPAAYTAGQAVIDSATGEAKTSLYATKMIAVGAEQYVFGKMVQADMAFDSFMDSINAMNPTVIPILGSAAASASKYASTPVVGSILTEPSGTGNYKVNSITGPQDMNALPNQEAYMQSLAGWKPATGSPKTSYVTMEHISRTTYPDGSAQDHWHKTIFYVGATSLAPTIPLVIDPSKFATAVPDSQASRDEINAVFAANPGAVTAPGLSADEIAQAYEQAEALAAQNYADEVLAESQADPTNQELQVLALEAQQAADQAALEAEQKAAEQETQKEEEKFISPAVTSPARNSIDLSPFYDLQGLAASKFPFSLVASISSFFNSLTGERRAPAIVWDYRGLVHFNISLSCWDSYAANLRLLIAFFFHSGVLYAITRRWSH